MRKGILTPLFMVSFLSLSNAQFGTVPQYELGVVLGEPLGISGKVWLSQHTALDGAVAWSFTENGLFSVYADYLIHPYFFEFESATLPIYFGVGPEVRIGNDWFIGGRLPIGAEYIFDFLPVSFFGEIAPQWQLIPDNKFVLSGGVGVRLTFGTVE